MTRGAVSGNRPLRIQVAGAPFGLTFEAWDLQKALWEGRVGGASR